MKISGGEIYIFDDSAFWDDLDRKSDEEIIRSLSKATFSAKKITLDNGVPLLVIGVDSTKGGWGRKCRGCASNQSE